MFLIMIHIFYDKYFLRGSVIWFYNKLANSSQQDFFCQAVNLILNWVMLCEELIIEKGAI